MRDIKFQTMEGLRAFIKISTEVINEIKERIKKGHRNIDIANDLNVRYNLISQIKTKRLWDNEPRREH